MKFSVAHYTLHSVSFFLQAAGSQRLEVIRLFQRTSSYLRLTAAQFVFFPSSHLCTSSFSSLLLAPSDSFPSLVFMSSLTPPHPPSVGTKHSFIDFFLSSCAPSVFPQTSCGKGPLFLSVVAVGMVSF